MASIHVIGGTDSPAMYALLCGPGDSEDHVYNGPLRPNKSSERALVLTTSYGYTYCGHGWTVDEAMYASGMCATNRVGYVHTDTLDSVTFVCADRCTREFWVSQMALHGLNWGLQCLESVLQVPPTYATNVVGDDNVIVGDTNRKFPYPLNGHQRQHRLRKRKCP